MNKTRGHIKHGGIYQQSWSLGSATKNVKNKRLKRSPHCLGWLETTKLGWLVSRTHGQGTLESHFFKVPRDRFPKKGGGKTSLVPEAKFLSLEVCCSGLRNHRTGHIVTYCNQFMEIDR